MKNILLRFLIAVVLFISALPANAQLPPAFKPEQISSVRSTELVRKYLTPVRVVWTSDNNSGTEVINRESILQSGNGQADQQTETTYLTLVSSSTSKPGIVLDFGREIQGGLEIVAT